VPAADRHAGVRPQRTPGRALVTAHVPLGDLDADDLRGLADLADELADGQLVLTGRQNVTLRHVPVEAVPTARERLAAMGLSLAGGEQAGDLRACTGGPVCALSITSAQETAQALRSSPALARNSGLRVHVSGCQNSCAQDQIADLGFTGGKVTVGGEAALGYQVWVGGDLRRGRLAQVLGRVAAVDVPAVAEAVVGVWEALRTPGESLGETVDRVGVEAVTAHIAAVFAGRWEPGAEPEPDGAAGTPGSLATDRRLPLAVAS
jgi:ferredoxin-nitrite reductase